MHIMNIIELTLVSLLAFGLCCCNQKGNSEFTRVYTMKKNDSTVIGDVYVKFENDSLFRYLYVINKNDTLYSIKKNALFKKDRIVDIEGSDVIYGYTFVLKEDDNFTISIWDKNGECAGDDASVVWDYDNNIMEFLSNC